MRTFANGQIVHWHSHRAHTREAVVVTELKRQPVALVRITKGLQGEEGRVMTIPTASLEKGRAA